MAPSDWHLDQALETVDRETAATISALSARTLERPGNLDCVECGVTLPLARRIAAPFATRCVSCQSELEMRKGGL